MWVEPLIAQLELRGLPYREWFIDDAELDLSLVPPEGVFYNRMSASSHTRDHRFAWEATRGVMAWLESHGRRVVNNRKATALEVSKVEQMIALRDHGRRPRVPSRPRGRTPSAVRPPGGTGPSSSSPTGAARAPA